MNNLDKIAECARMAVVFYDNDDEENYITAIKILYNRLIKESPDVRSGLNGEMNIGSNEKDEEPIKPWQVY